MPPPAFEYAYWKCYYAANSKAFKAAELYSTDVDYFTFGSCRLVHGAYYCGRFSATAPYKGLVDARQPTASGFVANGLGLAKHLGTDPLRDANGRIARIDDRVPTGTRLHLATNPNEQRLQRAANPAYYEPRHAGGHGNEFTTGAIGNNGLRTSAPQTAPSSRGGTGVFNVGHQYTGPASATSNYATDRAIAEAAYGIVPGRGTHVVGSRSS